MSAGAFRTQPRLSRRRVERVEGAEQNSFPSIPKRGAGLPTRGMGGRVVRQASLAGRNARRSEPRAAPSRERRLPGMDEIAIVRRCSCFTGEGRGGLGRKDLKWRQSMWSGARTGSRGSR